MSDMTVDRSDDRVYTSTTSVVRAVMDMTRAVHQATPDQYIDMVKRIGVQLKELLGSVDEQLQTLPSETHLEVSW